MIDSYGTLQAGIKRWLARPELEEALLDDFIVLAESRINKDLRAPDMLVERQADIQYILTDAPTVSVPEDLATLKAIFLVVDSMRTVVKPLTEDRIKTDAYFFERRGSHFALFPKTIDEANTSCVIQYFQRIPPLSAKAVQNWLIRTHPEIYLYAALLEATPWVQHDDRVPLWLSAYDMAVARLNKTATHNAYSQRLDMVYGRAP